MNRAAGLLIAATAQVSKMNAIKVEAQVEAGAAQAQNLAAAKEAANKSTAATTSNVGSVSSQSEEEHRTRV